MEIKNLKLRGFLFSDLKKIMEIERVSFPNRETYSENYFKKLHQKYPEGFIVAENSQGEILGYAIGQAKKNLAEIISLAVNPKWRRKGIGTLLTNFLIKHFQKRNLKEILLHVRTKNELATSFYKKLGFKILKEIKSYYQNGEDAYLMEKRI